MTSKLLTKISSNDTLYENKALMDLDEIAKLTSLMRAEDHLISPSTGPGELLSFVAFHQ